MGDIGKKENQSDVLSSCCRTSGFSLVELLIALAVGMGVLGAIYGLFITHNRIFAAQESFVEMQQGVRAGMDMMVREIRMAGYNPGGIAGFIGVPVNAATLTIRADLNGDRSITGHENIVYSFDNLNNRITRNIGSGKQPFIENVQSFSFQYLDNSGNVTAISANVRSIRITITGRTANPDPSYTANSGYRTFTLTSVISPRNLG